MDRMTIFIGANNEAGFVQAVILENEYPHFQPLGFVSSVDDVTPWTPRAGGGPADTDPTARTGDETNANPAAGTGDTPTPGPDAGINPDAAQKAPEGQDNNGESAE